MIKDSHMSLLRIDVVSDGLLTILVTWIELVAIFVLQAEFKGQRCGWSCEYSTSKSVIKDSHMSLQRIDDEVSEGLPMVLVTWIKLVAIFVLQAEFKVQR